MKNSNSIDQKSLRKDVITIQENKDKKADEQIQLL